MLHQDYSVGLAAPRATLWAKPEARVPSETADSKSHHFRNHATRAVDDVALDAEGKAYGQGSTGY